MYTPAIANKENTLYYSSMQPPTHYPQEYIDGYTTFFGKRVRVTPDTLIPRLETECLVRRARSYLQHEPHTAVIDV